MRKRQVSNFPLFFFFILHPSYFVLIPSLFWPVWNQPVLDLRGKCVDRSQVKLIVVAAGSAVLGDLRRENDFDAVFLVDDLGAVAGYFDDSQRSGHRAAVKIERGRRFRAEVVDLNVKQS